MHWQFWRLSSKCVCFLRSLFRRHADGTYTSDVSSYLQDQAAKEFVSWLKTGRGRREWRSTGASEPRNDSHWPHLLLYGSACTCFFMVMQLNPPDYKLCLVPKNVVKPQRCSTEENRMFESALIIKASSHFCLKTEKLECEFCICILRFSSSSTHLCFTICSNHANGLNCFPNNYVCRQTSRFLIFRWKSYLVFNKEMCTIYEFGPCKSNAFILRKICLTKINLIKSIHIDLLWYSFIITYGHFSKNIKSFWAVESHVYVISFKML